MRQRARSKDALSAFSSHLNSQLFNSRAQGLSSPARRPSSWRRPSFALPPPPSGPIRRRPPTPGSRSSPAATRPAPRGCWRSRSLSLASAWQLASLRSEYTRCLTLSVHHIDYVYDCHSPSHGMCLAYACRCVLSDSGSPSKCQALEAALDELQTAFDTCGISKRNSVRRTKQEPRESRSMTAPPRLQLRSRHCRFNLMLASL